MTLEIIVTANDAEDAECPSYPLVARITGTRARGYGHSVVAAIKDLFSAFPAEEAARALEQHIRSAADVRQEDR